MLQINLAISHHLNSETEISSTILENCISTIESTRSYQTLPQIATLYLRSISNLILISLTKNDLKKSETLTQKLQTFLYQLQDQPTKIAYTQECI